MHRSVKVDLARVFRDEVPGGLPRRRLQDGLARLRTVQEALAGAPSLAPAPTAESIAVVAGALRARAARLVVAGQPGAVEAARVLVDVLAPGAPVDGLATPEPDDLPGAGEGGRAWVAVLGPVWVEALVDAAAARGEPVVVVGTPAPDGEPVEPIGRAHV